MIFVGVDWAESHHDVAVKDASGITLIRRRIPDDVEGIRIFHEFVGPLIDDPNEVLVGIETDRGLFVGSLVASGYRVFAVNPFSSSRYRDRHASSGAKSDPGDAEVLADLVRTDSHNHREIAGDSEMVEAVKILARAHQSMIWTRQRQMNVLRSTLREYFRQLLLLLVVTSMPARHSKYSRLLRHRHLVEDSLVQRSPRHFAVLVDNAASKSGLLRSKRPCELTNYKLQR